jgi:hypothetical protein
MYFGLSEEQQELAGTVRSLLDRRADSSAVRTAIGSPAGYDEELWHTLCAQIGAAALAIPEELGGAGFSVFESLVVLEELGRSLAPSPLLPALMAAEAIAAAGDQAAAGRLLPRIAEGELATLANLGPDGRPLPAIAAACGADVWILSGTADNVVFGDQAAIVLVAATTDDGPALFEVDPDMVTRDALPAMDPATRLARLELSDTPATRLGGADALARARDVRAVAIAATQVGCAQRGLDLTVDYSKERVQFGRPIGSFQALKHRMADMLVAVETARSAAWAAGYAVANATADAETLAVVAATHCTEALDHVAAETVQLHGGIAITWEHDAHLVFKRAHALRQLVGQPHVLRARLIS